MKDVYSSYRDEQGCASLLRLSKRAQRDLLDLAWLCALKICTILAQYSNIDCKTVADWYEGILDEMLTATYATEVK